MSPLIFLLLIPLIWPWISKLIWPRQVSWIEIGAQIAVVSLLVFGTYQLGKVGKTSDKAIINGQVTAKHRVEDSHLESYQCNCHTVYSGSGSNRTSHRQCSTCWRTRYTIDWTLSSTIGGIGIASDNSLSKSIWNKPNPQLFDIAYIGEPCSKIDGYTNYVKAVPESLFGALAKTKQKKYEKLIPKYPELHSIYKVNRVINVGSKVPQASLNQLSDLLNDANKTLGPSKQVNILAVVTNQDETYRYALENAWIGGKINDVVVFIGTKDGVNIEWADVMTWALNKGNGVFHSTMKDDLTGVKVFDATKLSAVIAADITKLYDRPHMKDFEYLEKEVRPATWVLILAFFLSIIGSIGCTVFALRNDDF